MQDTTLKALADRFGLTLRGDPDHRVASLATLASAGPGDISFLANPAYAGDLAECRAGAVIIGEDLAERWSGNALISANPYASWARIAALLHPQPAAEPGIHATAAIADDAHIDASASVGPHTSIGARARIGRSRESVPLLEDLLGTWPELRLNIDVKSAGAILPLARALERTRAHERVCVASFSDQRRREVLMRLTRPVVTSAGQTTAARFRAAAALPALLRTTVLTRVMAGVDGLQVPVRHAGVDVVTPSTLAAAHEIGTFLHVWTVNEAAEMHRLLDLGVDGIVTDRADLLRDVLTSRGQWA